MCLLLKNRNVKIIEKYNITMFYPNYLYLIDIHFTINCFRFKCCHFNIKVHEKKRAHELFLKQSENNF